MDRHLPAMLCGAFFLFLLTLTACDQKPPVVEVPGTDAAKQEGVTPGGGPSGEVPADPFITGNIMGELEKLTRLPEDRSLESLANFLASSNKNLMLMGQLLERLPEEKLIQFQKKHLKTQLEAAELILKNDAATHPQVRMAAQVKKMELQLAYAENDLKTFDRFAEEIAAYRKAGKTQIAWELELALLLADIYRSDENFDSLEALEAAAGKFIGLRRRAVDLLASGKENATLTSDSLAGLMSVVLQLDTMTKPSEEGDQDMKTLREVLTSIEPNEELQVSAIKNCLLQMDLEQLMKTFRRTFQQENGETEPKPEDLDALLTGVIEAFKKAEAEKVSLTPMNVLVPLQLANHLEKEASGEKIEALYNTLLATLEAGESENKAKIIELVQARIRLFNLPGHEMEFQAIKPDRTPVSLKDFAGKVVLLEMLYLQQQDAFIQEFRGTKQLQEMYKGTDLQIVWYLAASRPEEISQMAEAMGMTWNITLPVPDGTGTAAPLDYYGIFELPRTLLIGRDGKVISTNVPDADLLIELHRLFPEVKLPEAMTPRVEAVELETPSETPAQPTEPLPMPEEVQAVEVTVEETPVETPVEAPVETPVEETPVEAE